MTKTDKMIGAGIGLAALAALGTYFLYGKHGEKNREKIAGWMLKLKGEVLEKVEELKEDINKETYYRIVDDAAARYAKVEKVGEAELQHLKEELRVAWEHISEQVK